MELMTRRAACAMTSYLLLLTAQFALVKSDYPKCQDLSEIQASWYRAADNPQASAITNCTDACAISPHVTTLAGVRRNGGGASNVACYCGDADVSLVVVSGCSYSCEDDPYNCGGPDAVSVHTVCDPGLYKPDCSAPCVGNCADDVCDIDTGKCNGQCQDQYYGSYCEHWCPPHCAADTCDKDTGLCDGGCDPGYYTPLCNEECSPNCAQTSCDIDDGTCDGGCQDGFYGSHCNMTCPHCGNDRCDQTTAECEGGCDPGYYTPRCNEECSQNCAQTSCDIDDGTCDVGCKEGWYGSHCDSACPTNCDGGCDRSSGDCTKCDAGTYGSKCDTPCPDNCHQSVCDFSSGNCTQGCNVKLYGPECDTPCSTSCNMTLCDSNDGTCQYGCLPGYHGAMCSSPCPDHCRHNTCEFETGHCSHGCEDGFYGSQFCELICPENCAGNVCDNVEGDCSFCCKTGWNGSRCDDDIDECIDASSNVCGSLPDRYDCYNTNGSYVCCGAGFDVEKLTCNSDDKDTAAWVWPVIIVVAVLTGALGFVGGAFFWSKRQTSPERRESTDVDSTCSNQAELHVPRHENATTDPEENTVNVVNLQHKIYVNVTEEIKGQLAKKSESRRQLDNELSEDVSEVHVLAKRHSNGSYVNSAFDDSDQARRSYVNVVKGENGDIGLSYEYEEYKGRKQPPNQYDALDKRASLA